MRTSLFHIMRSYRKKRKHDTIVRVEKRVKHLKRSDIAEAVGWIGSVAILGSYFLLSFGIIDGQSYIYHSLILVGSIGLAIITFRHRAFQSFVVNTAFFVFATIALVRLFILS